ncbi:MAG TPA: hypothetical protein VFG94_12950 [Acidimicrobiales bacterium]|nr:hypothetical protein [Acidimicrobiales bacterium]
MSAWALVGLGFVVGIAMRRRRSLLVEQRRSGIRALRRLRRMIAELDEAATTGEVEATVAAALTDVLHLRRCAFEPAPTGPVGSVEGTPLPSLSATGEIDARVVHRVPRGVVRPAASIPAAGGRYVLTGGPVGCTLEERLVASAMVAAGDRRTRR